MRGDEFGFARVPGFEDFMGRCTAENYNGGKWSVVCSVKKIEKGQGRRMLTARVNEACESHTRNVAGAAEDTLKIPNSLCTVCMSVHMPSFLPIFSSIYRVPFANVRFWVKFI